MIFTTVRLPKVLLINCCVATCAWHAVAEEVAPRSALAEMCTEVLPQHAIARFESARFRTAKSARRVRVTSLGTLLITHDYSEEVRIWKISEGQLLASFLHPLPHANKFGLYPRLRTDQDDRRDAQCYAISDGEQLIAVLQTSAVTIIDAVTGESRVQAWTDEGKSGEAIVFVPESHDLIVGFQESLARYDADTGRLVKRWPHQNATPRRLKFHNKSRLLHLFATDDTSTWYRWETGEVVRVDDSELDAAHEFDYPRKPKVSVKAGGRILSYDVTSDKRLFGVGVDNGRAIICESESGRHVQELPQHEDEVEFIDCSDDGTVWATCEGRDRVRLWRYDRADERAALKELFPDHGHRSEIFNLQFTSDGQRLMSQSLDGTARIWSVDTQALLTTVDDASHASLSARGGKLAVYPPFVSLHVKPKIRVYDVGMSHQATLTTRINGRGGVLSPEGNRIAYMDHDDSYKFIIWDLRRERILQSFKAIKWKRMAWSPDGRLIAHTTFEFANPVHVWDASTGKLHLKVQQMDPEIVCFTPDSSRLITIRDPEYGKPPDAIHVWDLETGRKLRVFGRDSRVRSCAVLSDNRRLLTGCEDGLIRVWDLATGRILYKLTGHRATITALAASPAGDHFVSGAADSEMLMWDASQLVLAE